MTHDQIEAMTLADRIAVMNAGRIEQLGTPLELYRAPVNRFVAGFIGSPAMNFLPGRVDGGRVRLDGTDVVLDARRPARPAAEGTPVEVGLRPEHLRPSPRPGPRRNRVAQVEPTGSQTHLLVDFAGRSLVAVLEGMVPLAPGESDHPRDPSGERPRLRADSGEAIGLVGQVRNDREGHPT